jgi:transposase
MRQFVLGIDVSKAYYDVHLIGGEAAASGRFNNNAEGFKQLKKWLKKQKVKEIHACLEATGRYGDDLALWLHEQEYKVSIINPTRIKKYGESKLQRNKTDKVDAKLIADFCLTQEPTLWTPPPEEYRELQALTRRLQMLVDNRTQEQNRLLSGVPSTTVLDSIQAHIDFLNCQMQSLEKQIQEHIDQYPTLKKQRELLISIPGIAQKTAAKIMAELPDTSLFTSADQVVAYAGLCPQQHESGSSVRKQARLTKTGKQQLKTAIFFPSLCAMRFNPVISNLTHRLRKQGKPNKVIAGAAMRKMIRLVYGVLKSGQPFDPHYPGNFQISS